MLNKVMIIGRLGKDPEIRYAANGTAIANFNVATDESYNDRDGNKVERTEWHRIKVFNKQAEHCKTFLSKGRLVFVEGSLQTRKWQDKQGQDRYSTDIVANRVKFLDRKNASQGMGAGSEDDLGSTQRSAGQGKPGKIQNDQQDDYGSPFPSEASGMDDVPF
jgi:single-strand DNA-binding protein